MRHELAYDIAKDAVGILQPHCTDITIAGDLRRCESSVEEITLVIAPKYDYSTNLLGEVTGAGYTSGLFKAISALGFIKEGSMDSTMRYCRIDAPHGIPIDIFITTKEDYWRQVAHRTGPYEYYRYVLASAWNQMGWCETINGLRKTAQCVEPKDLSTPFYICIAGKYTIMPPEWNSEEHLYAWLGITYLKPHLRGSIKNNYIE